MSARAFENVIPNVVSRWDGRRVTALHPLTPDASLRRYFRVEVTPPPKTGQTVVAMCFDSVVSPEAGGGQSVAADVAYVELSRFLHKNGLRVPELLFDARDEAVLLIEDFGDRLLFDLFRKNPSDDEVLPLYRAALQQILKLQRIPAEKKFFPYQRSFTGEQYRKEMGEFRDFYLNSFSGADAATKVSEELFITLANELEKFPRVLVHRDFHSWNLMVLGTTEIGVIDFQDALLAPSTYDLVALLNDRDTDAALGSKRYRTLLTEFGAAVGGGQEFLEQYARVLLQRDLKVVGRFCKLATVRGLVRYKQWVPGTLRRIGSTLQRISAAPTADIYRKALQNLSGVSEEIRQGAEAGAAF